ncbi:MAG: RecBCD enzyme subunit RecC, partial [Pseudomonadota bacterium]|nr:RecBCD enzyme subunit RecC [Pseudomonadota bacterium]
GFMRDAECDDPCWSRLYPDFDALSADGRFEVLTDEVWGRVQTWATNHVMVTMHEAVTDEVVAQDEAAMPTAVEVKA